MNDSSNPSSPLYSLHPTLWDRRVRQRHNAPFISPLILTQPHTHTQCLYHKDNNNNSTEQQETVKDIFPIVWMWCVCCCACLLFALWHQLFSFSCSLSVSLSHSQCVSLSLLAFSLFLSTHDSEVRKKNFYLCLCFMQCEPISHIGVYPRMSGAELELPHISWEVGGGWRTVRIITSEVERWCYSEEWDWDVMLGRWNYM